MSIVRPTKPALLQVSGLRKAVPGGRLLFSDLDFSLDAGEFAAVTGESGVGKSTLLNLIAGLDLADDGEVRIEGVCVGDLDDDARTLLRRDRIGFVFQAFHVLPHLTLAQNVAMPLALQRLPGKEALNRARDELAKVGLGDRGEDFPPQLSGGELQRVAIARAIVHRPALILADEPTGNLDPETAGKVLEIFVAQARDLGAAVLLVTHSDTAAACADRILRLTARGLASAVGA